MTAWTLELPGRPPTANKQRAGKGSHWSKRAASTKQWRETAKLLQLSAVNAGTAPRCVDQIAVTVCQLSKDRRWLADLGAHGPAAKAAIDGLVDAGLIPDDKPAHLVSLTFTTPVVCGRDAMRLTIEAITPKGAGV